MILFYMSKLFQTPKAIHSKSKPIPDLVDRLCDPSPTMWCPRHFYIPQVSPPEAAGNKQH